MKKSIVFMLLCILLPGYVIAMEGSNIMDNRIYNLPLVSTGGIPFGLPPVLGQNSTLIQGKFLFASTDKRIYGELRRGMYSSYQEMYLFGFMLGTFFEEVQLQSKVPYSGKKFGTVGYITTALVSKPKREDIADSFYIFFLEISVDMSNRAYCFIRVQKDAYEDMYWHILSFYASVLDIDELPYVPKTLDNPIQLGDEEEEETTPRDIDTSGRQFLTFL